jgi:hypothetical protein
MKAFFAGIAAFVCVGAAHAQWYSGGDLHRSTLREWSRATASNQLATLADIVGKTLKMRDPDAVKPKALEVQACVNVVARNAKLSSQPVADTAVGCMFQLGYLPN